MANCSSCGRDVGCGCNLIGNLCMSCYSDTLVDSGQAPKTATSRQVLNLSLKEPSAPTQFDMILNDTTLTKDERLQRINNIINLGA